MRLDKVQITNFRCADDTGEFRLSDVTCLVGKNESGKTTILQALEKFHPYLSAHEGYNKLLDYPRKYHSEYAERHPNDDAKVVNTEWTLSASDIAAVEHVLGPSCLSSPTIKVAKGYSGDAAWAVNVNHRNVISFLLEGCGASSEEQEEIIGHGTTENVFLHLSKQPELSPSLLVLKGKIQPFRGQRANLAAIDILYPLMPKFLYFSSYDRMSGDVSLDKLRQDVANNTVSEGDRVFLAFLEFAGTTLDELSKIDKFEELRARVESASVRITRQIFEYWSQNKHLKVTFTIDAGRAADTPPFNTGTIMRARVYNQLHEMTGSFNERSAGFIWFFSFLVLFSQVKKNHGNVIILLDEPGLNLHAKAQGDLLRYFNEKLKPEHQVLYTTHSPFMVPPQDLDSVRTVEDVVKTTGQFEHKSFGTKVGSDVLSTDRDTLFPLQAALGYEITQSLFIGEHTLLVEGPSEILYLSAVSAELARRGKVGLSKLWTVCPCQGVDKIQAFMSLFGGNGLHIAVLLDVAAGQKGMVQRLQRSELLRAGHVLTIPDFCEKTEADIEDMFDADLYAKLINGAYSLTGPLALTGKDLTDQTSGSSRLVKNAEIAVNTAVPVGDSEFTHLAPASWLIEHPSVLWGDDLSVSATLDRFERLFIAINALL